MTKRNKNFTFLNFKNFVMDSIKECKIKSILLACLMVVALLTGIIVAIKTRSDWGTANGFGVIDVKTGSLTSTFFTRLFSMLLIYFILFGTSYSSFFYPIAVIFLSYRAYLLGLNISLIIIFYGFSGAVISIFVALPCQLCVLFVLLIFYILLCRTVKDFKYFGGCKINNQKIIICLSTLICLFVLCIVESLLLLIFSAKIILII